MNWVLANRQVPGKRQDLSGEKSEGVFRFE